MFYICIRKLKLTCSWRIYYETAVHITSLMGIIDGNPSCYAGSMSRIQGVLKLHLVGPSHHKFYKTMIWNF